MDQLHCFHALCFSLFHRLGRIPDPLAPLPSLILNLLHLLLRKLQTDPEISQWDIMRVEAVDNVLGLVSVRDEQPRTRQIGAVSRRRQRRKIRAL